VSLVDPSLRVREAAPADRPAWDRFVEAHPEAIPFHLWGLLEAVGSGLGHRCPAILAERAGRVVGVLPLVAVESRLFGRALVATGFAVAGGPLAAEPEAGSALLERAEALARSGRFDRLELRCPPPDRPGWRALAGRHSSFRRALDPDPEANFRKLRNKQRNMVRKGRSLGLRIEPDPGCERFWPLYAASVHRLGTPVLPKTWFRTLEREFGERCETLVVLQGDRSVAGVMSFYFRATVMPYYAGGIPEARQLAAHDFTYDALMRHAVVARGCRSFDLGRSKVGSGHAEFKRHWGFEASPVVYGYWSPSGRPPPDLDPRSERNRWLVAAWQRLPRGLADRLGPWLARQIG
jgi:FemAB-related protein (PEP-CTERM system-associated)